MRQAERMKLTESHGREESPLEESAQPEALRCSAGFGELILPLSIKRIEARSCCGQIYLALDKHIWLPNCEKNLFAILTD